LEQQQILFEKNGMILIALIFIFIQPSFAASVLSQALRSNLVQEVEKQFPSAKIELQEEVRWVKKNDLSKAKSISYLKDDRKGNLYFSIMGPNFVPIGGGWMEFSAWVEARIAKESISRGKKLSESYFFIEKIDLSRGKAREYSKMILPIKTEFPIKKYKSVQVISKGEFLMKDAIQKIPDVIQGDRVKVEIISPCKKIKASLFGIAKHDAEVQQMVEVLTSENQRMKGVLRIDQTVEVR